MSDEQLKSTIGVLSSIIANDNRQKNEQIDEATEYLSKLITPKERGDVVNQLQVMMKSVIGNAIQAKQPKAIIKESFSDISSLVRFLNALNNYETHMNWVMKDIQKPKPYIDDLELGSKATEAQNIMRKTLSKVKSAISESLPEPFQAWRKRTRDTEASKTAVQVLAEIHQGRSDHSERDLLTTKQVIAAMTTDHVYNLQEKNWSKESVHAFLQDMYLSTQQIKNSMMNKSISIVGNSETKHSGTRHMLKDTLEKSANIITVCLDKIEEKYIDDEEIQNMSLSVDRLVMDVFGAKMQEKITQPVPDKQIFNHVYDGMVTKAEQNQAVSLFSQIKVGHIIQENKDINQTNWLFRNTGHHYVQSAVKITNSDSNEALTMIQDIVKTLTTIEEARDDSMVTFAGELNQDIVDKDRKRYLSELQDGLNEYQKSVEEALIHLEATFMDNEKVTKGITFARVLVNEFNHESQKYIGNLIEPLPVNKLQEAFIDEEVRVNGKRGKVSAEIFSPVIVVRENENEKKDTRMM